MKNIISGDEGHIESLHSQLCARIHSGFALKNVYIAAGKRQHSKVDLIYIGFGGVLLFSVLSEEGSYITPAAPNEWSHSSLGQDELCPPKAYENPFTTLCGYKGVIQTLLEHEDIRTPGVIRECVVCATPRASFSEAHGDLIYYDQLGGYIRNFNIRVLLSSYDRRAAFAIIDAFDAYNRAEQIRLDAIAEAVKKASGIRAKREIDFI